MEDLELKKSCQQAPAHLIMADFKFGNMTIRYTNVLLKLTNPEGGIVWTAFLMRTIEMPGEDIMGEVIKTWVAPCGIYSEEITKLINKDREMLVKQLLQEEDEE